MYLADDIAAEGFTSAHSSKAADSAYELLRQTLDKKQRRLLLTLCDATTELLDLTAQDNYVRGLCMGLSFAERYCYRPKYEKCI